MTTQLTEAGQKLADALVKAGAMMPEDLTYPEQLAPLNTAAQILLTPEGGGMREASVSGAAERLVEPAAGTEERLFWLEAAEQHGFIPMRNIATDEVDFYHADEAAIIKLMFEARKQGRSDGAGLREALEADFQRYDELRLSALTPKTSVPGTDAGMREAFEAWIKGFGFPTRRRLGVYENSHTVMCWNAWQAAHKNAELVAPYPPTGSAGDDETGVRPGYPGLDRLARIPATVPDLALPQPPKAETPVGVGEDAVEAASAAFYDTMIGSEREFWPHHEGWAGKGEAFKAKVRGRMRTALEAVLSLAPAAGADKNGRLWDALHEAMICAWNLLDGTQNDASGVDQADWDALSASMTAVGALVPASEQPFSPSYAVPYLRALSLAPAARAGDGVERYKAGAMDMRDAAANAISAAGSRLFRDKGDALCVAALGDAALMVRALSLTAAPAANGEGA